LVINPPKKPGYRSFANPFDNSVTLTQAVGFNPTMGHSIFEIGAVLIQSLLGR
jgi:hypothetical protein